MSEMEEEIIVEAQTDKDEYILGELVRMTLKILNGGTMPIELVFTSAQRYDFIVLRDGEEVWRWSSKKVFAMVLGSLVLKPKEKRSYTEVLEESGMAAGNYQLVGIITSRPPLKATSRFIIKPP